MPDGARLVLLWIPLGAGTSIVPRCGRAYERVIALRERRAPRRLLHAALVATSADGTTVTVEVGPVAAGPSGRAGAVVAAGAVGSPLLGRSRWFRYEVRRWPGGTIPDAAHALARAVVSTSAEQVDAVLAALDDVPTPTWGRDELRAGEMWNSNSVVAWALARCGLAARAGAPPEGCRAPGWDAGLRVAARSAQSSAAT